ncbi:MAG: M16 family metallopeptidase [Vulcanimicrobiota bacterium]
MGRKRKKEKITTQKIELDNKTRILVREDHSNPIISMVAAFRGGRCLETEENNGLTSLCMRTLMSGCDGYDLFSLNEELEQFGISIYPFYGADTLGLKMNCISKHFDKGLELFRIILLSPTFPEEELEKEKENLIEDIKKEKDDIFSYSLNVCRRLVFEDHSYGLPVYGTDETVSKLNRQAVMDYHKNLFCPRNMVISFVGDIEAEQARQSIEDNFKDYDFCGEIPEVEKAKKSIKNVKEETITTEKQQVAICIGFHAPSIYSEDFYTFKVLNQVLSGMGSRLFIELRDRQSLAYSVNSRYTSYMGGGIFQAYILTSYKHKEKARLSLLEEVDRLRTRLVTYDELVRAKRYHLGLFDIGLQRKISKASKLGFYEIAGQGYDFIDGYSEKIKRITRQKVKRAAEKYLKPQCYAISILSPATFPKSLR